QIDFAEFVEHVATLEASHLIRRSGARLADTVEAYHDRVSDAVLENLTAAAVREYHGRLAVALETAQRTDAETLAVHWRAAGQPSTRSRPRTRPPPRSHSSVRSGCIGCAWSWSRSRRRPSGRP